MSVKVLSIEDDGVAAVACEGELNGLGMNNGDVADLKPQLGDDWAQRRVALDMTGASYMDSAAVGWLLSLHKAFQQSGGQMVVCGIQPEIRRVIELMRIDQVIPIVADRDEAMRRLRAGGEGEGGETNG